MTDDSHTSEYAPGSRMHILFQGMQQLLARHNIPPTALAVIDPNAQQRDLHEMVSSFFESAQDSYGQSTAANQKLADVIAEYKSRIGQINADPRAAQTTLSELQRYINQQGLNTDEAAIVLLAAGAEILQTFRGYFDTVRGAGFPEDMPDTDAVVTGAVRALQLPPDDIVTAAEFIGAGIYRG